MMPILLAAAWMLPTPAAGQSAPAAATPVTRVVECRRLTDPQARLACYDAAVDGLDRAVTGGSVVVVDREDIKRTRRSLFGFTLPKVPFFKGDNSQDDQPNEVVAVVTAARALPYDKWQIAIEGGAVWQTLEESRNQSLPKVGQKVRIRSGALGSYRLSVIGGQGLRAMRIR